MYRLEKLFKDFYKSQMVIGKIEQQTREQAELEGNLWESFSDCSPEQKAYEDSLPEPKELKGAPF